jgi:hypothetical protein
MTDFLRFSIDVRMHETQLTASTSHLVKNEIQRISVAASTVSEQLVCLVPSPRLRKIALFHLANPRAFQSHRWNS